MTDLKIEASSFKDPVFDQLRKNVEGCSDSYPVLLLPVRLETRFKKVTRYADFTDPNQGKIQDILTRLRKMTFDLRVLNRAMQKPPKKAFLEILAVIENGLSQALQNLNNLKKVVTLDRQNIRETLADLKSELNKVPIKESDDLHKLTDQILSIINKIQRALRNLGDSSPVPFKPGWDALGELQKLGDEMDRIYGKKVIPAAEIDETLKRIDAAMKQFTAIVEKPDFMAADITIKGIRSKISYIKRSQKNSPVRLTDFRKAYSGTTNLLSREYSLRNEINDLKNRIDRDYIPYMEILAKIRQFPARQLVFKVTNAACWLRAVNTAGFDSAGALLAEKDKLYSLLREIREHAHLLLQGSIEDIHFLKSEYHLLEKEILRFIEGSRKAEPISRSQRGSLTRMRTHLTEEYLKDLAQLRPGEKTIESQAFSSAKLRMTASSYQNTMRSIQETADCLRKMDKKSDKAALYVREKLDKLEKTIRITASNTMLLPRDFYTGTLNAYQRFSAQLENILNEKEVSKDHPIRKPVTDRLDSIKNSITDQLTDIVDQKDRFYDEFRKRIKFLVKSETVHELWVRIFPDDIAIDNHDERLTEYELQVGKAYYNEIYSRPSSARKDIMPGAWRAAATSLGARRAAYVISEICPMEVTNEVAPDPANLVRPLLKKLSKAFTIKRSEWAGKHEVQFTYLVKYLPDILLNALDKTNFNACSRTFPDLERLEQILTEAISWYENALEKPKEFNVLKEKQIFGEYQSLRQALLKLQDYIGINIVALNQAFDPGLTFPGKKVQTAESNRAGVTSVMPDRFVVIAKRDGIFTHIKTGKTIQQTLPVGFNPLTVDEDFLMNGYGDLEVPGNLRWLFDFDAAEEAGMAVRIPLSKEDFEKGFDFVMAYGIRTHNELAPEKRSGAGQELLNGLLKSHLYSDNGLEFLPVGTATNNTDEVKSPYKTLDHDHEGLFNLFINPETNSYQIISPKNSENELEITDGQYFRDALGLPDDISRYIRYHEKNDISLSHAMSRLLYGATLGYYMRFMLRNLLNENDIDRTPYFLVNHVSAVGNLPAFRVNKQPYGVLPITLHNKLWVDEPIDKGTLGSYLHKLSLFLSATRKVFESDMLKKVNTINGKNYEDDPQKVFLEILGLEPFSKDFLYREGANVGGRWGDIDDIPEAAIISWSEQNAVNPSAISEHYKYLLNRIGHTSSLGRMKAILKSRAYGARYVNSNDFLGFLVQDPALGSDKLITGFDGNKNYIQYLHDLASSELNLFNIPLEPTTGKNYPSLLFELIRISLLYDNKVFALRAAEKVSGLEVPVLERLMAGHLDLCSYRIDAWLSALADYQLKELRAKKSDGIFLGAYGFVENLRPSPPLSRVDHFPDGLEPQNGADVYIMPDNQGFIHGPTLNHAVTAAVLRAGYNSQKKNENDSNNIFGINLSSSRVRKALHLLEGVAGGQETGALLGYQFERALHESYGNLEMDAYIYRLRRKFQTYADNPVSQATAFEQKDSIRALNVVDGLGLLDHMENFITSSNVVNWDDDKTFTEMLIRETQAGLEFPGFPWGLENQLPPIDSDKGAKDPDHNKLIVRAFVHELDNIADGLDAMGDLITAEGVYQLVRGNHTRAGAVLSAMSEGRVPADPDIIRTMREGNMVSQRVLMVLDPASPQNPLWSNTPSPRSSAEPSLNQWLGSQIGDPERIEWSVFKQDSHKPDMYVSLADLKMQPIDLIFLAAGGEQGLAGLELRTAAIARSKGITGNIRIDFNQCSSENNSSLSEYLSLLQHLAKVVLKSRCADARDFKIAESDDCFGPLAPEIDTDNLYSRLRMAVDGLTVFLGSLSPFKPGIDADETLMALAVEKSIELEQWGFAGYYPDIKNEKERLDLIVRIIGIKDSIKANLDKADILLAQLPREADQAKWLDASNEISSLIFGKGFKILPRIKSAGIADLKSRMSLPDAGGILRNINDESLETWLSDAAMVRSNLASIDTVRMLTDVLKGEKMAFSVAQLPEIINEDGTTDEYWLGAAYPDTWQPDGDKLSLVIFGYGQLSDPFNALLLDEWTEIIPAKSQTTGIALHYNQPDSRPPQAVLLAVSPDVTGAWSLDDLGLIVEEAYQMARLRAVEPDHFNNTLLAQILPATTMLAGGEEDVVRRMFSIPVIGVSGKDKKGVLANFGNTNEIENNA